MQVLNTIPTFPSAGPLTVVAEDMEHCSPREVRLTADNASLKLAAIDLTKFGIVSPLRIQIASDAIYACAEKAALKLSYEELAVHATLSSGSVPTMYCQIEASVLALPDNSEIAFEMTETCNDGIEENAVPEEVETVDLYMEFPEMSPEQLSEVYMAMSECAALHPSYQSDDGAEGGDSALAFDMSGFYTGENAEGEVEMSEEGNKVLARLGLFRNDKLTATEHESVIMEGSAGSAQDEDAEK